MTNSLIKRVTKYRNRKPGNPEPRRQAFIALYNSNPMNFLPGDVGTIIYRNQENAKAMRRHAIEWIKVYPERARHLNIPSTALEVDHVES